MFFFLKLFKSKIKDKNIILKSLHHGLLFIALALILTYFLCIQNIECIKYGQGGLETLFVENNVLPQHIKVFPIHVAAAACIYRLNIVITLILVYNLLQNTFPNSIKYILSMEIVYFFYIAIFLTFWTTITGICWGKAAWGSYFVMDSKLIFLLIELVLLLSFVILKKKLDWSNLYFSQVSVSFFVISPFIKHISNWIAGLHQTSSVNAVKMTLSLEIFLLVILLVLVVTASSFFCYRYYVAWLRNRNYTRYVKSVT